MDCNIMELMGSSVHYHKLLSTPYIQVRTPYGPTKIFSTDLGCKQGCGFSPIVFVAFIDLFISWLNEQHMGYQAFTQEGRQGLTVLDENGVEVCNIGFVDDVNFFTDSEQRLNIMIHHFTVFLKCYGLNLNISKSKVVKWGAGSDPNYSIMVDGSTFNSPITVPYLLIQYFHFSPKGSWYYQWFLLEESLLKKAALIAAGPHDLIT